MEINVTRMEELDFTQSQCLIQRRWADVYNFGLKRLFTLPMSLSIIISYACCDYVHFAHQQKNLYNHQPIPVVLDYTIEKGYTSGTKTKSR